MVLQIRTEFVFPSEKEVKVLISDKYDMNLISTIFVEELLEDPVAQSFCGYVEKGFVIQFKQGKYVNGAECLLFGCPLNNNLVILSK